ncbi:SRPBCC family protein [Nocardia terpenica]|uniref:Coenzyme Q-binding protein COQ10 START domain-containing protein n=1 Tax=Nocardia terpenica TaxID=455432 RepID=A0A6G9YZP8_9NOCA|nr:SRPBCC family protein [Nocardia terpenica]QIS18293.1 hypothetical protein F6W96_08375 [Nocardia terpenica]
MSLELSHNIVCPAPAERVYALLTDPAGWPAILTPCKAARVLSATATTQTVELTMTAGSGTATWVTERVLRPEFYGVEEGQPRPMPRVERIDTSWRVVALDANSCVLLTEHVVDVAEDAAAHVRTMIHRNIGSALVDYRTASEKPRAATPMVMPGNRIRHTAECAADADTVYGIVCDTRSWPKLFDACVGVEIVREDGNTSDVKVFAEQDGRRVSWETRRTHHRALRRVDYMLPVPMPFVAEMAGQWRVIPLEAHRCLLAVDRWWTMLGDVTGIRDGIETVAQAADFVRSYVDTNAGAEMRAIAAVAR